jgi:pimeloyl-ACP methyl ester carboxylesterase
VHFFDSDGLQIAYESDGDGPAILLVHGFASSYRNNWKQTGWFEALRAHGRRVIGLDCRGHGQSGKPRDLARYTNGQMQQDVLRLMDHLRIEKADLMGYSMGSWLLLPLLANHADRFNCTVLGGAGAPLPETTSLHQAITAVLEGGDPPKSCTDLDRMIARGFKAFAEATGNDLAALACVLRSGVMRGDALQGLHKCPVPVLLVAGDKDTLAGDPVALGNTIAGSRVVFVTACDHLSTVSSPRFREVVLEFLEENGL